MAKKSIPSDLITLAHRLADASGQAIRPYFRKNIAVETKGDASPVTIADKNAEKAIRRTLEKERPQDGIWGEEGGSQNMDAEYLWVIDPIDGTKSFTAGMPIFGTLIGLFRGDEAILGVLDQPISKERWVGAQGKATTLNGKPVKCRPCSTLAAASIGTTGPQMFKSAKTLKQFGTISQASARTLYGGDCYLYGMLSMGFLDAVVEEQMHLHDFAALIPIVEGAGGVITDWQGKPLGRAKKSAVLATGDAKLHKKLRGMLG